MNNSPNADNLLSGDAKYRYQLLSRLKQDCDYYLGCGNGQAKHLWALDEAEHIEAMKTLWNSFDESEKPEWLSMEDIERYEDQFNSYINRPRNRP